MDEIEKILESLALRASSDEYNDDSDNFCLHCFKKQISHTRLSLWQAIEKELPKECANCDFTADLCNKLRAVILGERS